MDECKDCEFRGYSPQICMLHLKHRAKTGGGLARKQLPGSLRVGARALAGASLGVATVVVGSAAVSLVGGATLIHALLVKLSIGAGLAGGGIGFVRGLTGQKPVAIVKSAKPTQGSCRATRP